MDNRRQAARFLAPANQRTERPYEIADFARKHGLSAVKAREILEVAGNSRESADLLANRSKPLESRGS
jgi:hypothetical protein